MKTAFMFESRFAKKENWSTVVNAFKGSTHTPIVVLW